MRRTLKRRVLFLAAVFALTSGLPFPALAGDADPLFVNLTTSEPHRAKMALTFSAAQLERGHPLTIFLNDKGVMLASRAYATKFADHQKALADAMAKGATVIVCPMCMKAYKVKEADLVTGVQLGKTELTGGALFKEGTRTLTW